MRILALHSGLFPDQETVSAALRRMPAAHEVRWLVAPSRDSGDEAWDEVLRAILASDLIVTT